MKLYILGAGSAFGSDYQTNFLLEYPSGYKLLIDCGGDVRHSLRELGFSILDVDGIYISHLHNDHIGGMEYAAFFTMFAGNGKKVDLLVQSELVDPLWDSIRAGLKTIPKVPVLTTDFFKLKPLYEKNMISLTGKKKDPSFTLVRTKHVFNNDIPIPSFGLYFHDGYELFITTDTQYDLDNLRPYMEKAKIIIHDCETSPYPSGVHSHREDMKRYPEEIKNKTYLVHYNDNITGKIPTRTDLLEYIKCLLDPEVKEETKKAINKEFQNLEFTFYENNSKAINDGFKGYLRSSTCLDIRKK